MKFSFVCVVTFPILLALMVFLSACEKNEKLSMVDGDGDGPETSIDGDSDGELIEDDPYVKVELLHKWHNPQNSFLSHGSDSLLWSVSSAGIIVLDISGTPDDESDDVVLSHNELTLAGWPTDSVIAACADGSGALWIATQNGYFLFSYGADISDTSDDTLIAGNMEGQDAIADIKRLFCRSDAAGVWISTGAGFVAVDESADPADAAKWQRNSFIGSNNIMSLSPYAASFDGSQWLWMSVFEGDALKLYAVDTASVKNSGDTGINLITPGFADSVQISFLAVDSNKGLWIINGTKTFYFKHGGTTGDTSDDEWIELLAGTELELTALFPAESGLAFGVKGDTDFYRLDANNVAIRKMADAGFNTENSVKSMVSQSDLGLWYSSEGDFGLISYANDPADAAWTLKRYTAVGGVPSNNLSGFTHKGDAVYLGGPTGVTRIEYETGADVADFSFKSWLLEIPDNPAPFSTEVLTAIEDGVLVGGLKPAFISNSGEASVWDSTSSPANIYFISANQGDYLWMGSGQTVAGVMVPWFNIYYTGGSYKKTSDDKVSTYSNEYFGGLEAGPINDVDFIGDNAALFANDLGLFGIEFGEDRLDTEDLTVSVGLLGEAKSIRSITSAGDGGFWIGSLRDGLSYLDTKGTATGDDDEFLHYENVKMKSYVPELDDDGRLYYLVDEGIMVHDPMGTPLDDSDDMGVIVTLGYEQKPSFSIDGRGGIWFALQNGSGIYYARLSDGELKPWAEIRPEESAE